MTSAPYPPPKLLPAGRLRLVSDDRLVEQVRAGSDRAFEVLFDRHYRSLTAFCRQLLGSREEAEDVVQHTFLAAFCDVRASDKPITARPWLFTIARNRCVSVLRGRRELTADKVRLVADNLASELERREDLRNLLDDLARLPYDQRAALILTELRGVPQDEIATILGCRQARVKALVFQARASLAADRAARETPCHEIRSQLVTLRGAALRRAVLRRHLRSCAGCREFQAKVRLQRRELGALLPAGLGLPAVLTESGAAGLGGATLNAGVLGGGFVARALVGAALAGGGAAAGVTAVATTGPANTASPTAPAAAHEADARRALDSQGPARNATVAAVRVVAPVAGSVVGGANADVRGTRPSLATAVGLPHEEASEHAPADQVQGSGGAAAKPEETAHQPDQEEPAHQPDQDAASDPPPPSEARNPGDDEATGSGGSQELPGSRGSQGAHESGAHGPPSGAGRPAAPDLPAQAPSSRPPVPQGHRPGPQVPVTVDAGPPAAKPRPDPVAPAKPQPPAGPTAAPSAPTPEPASHPRPPPGGSRDGVGKGPVS